MKELKELLLDDIFAVVLALVFLGVISAFVLPPDIAEKILIGLSSGLAGIAKGRSNNVV